MKKPPRFAEGTEVPVAKTRQDIELMLARHGAQNCMSGSDFQSRAGFVAFTLERRQIRFQLHPYQPTPRPQGGGQPKDPEQWQREMWRALLLMIKAKLEAVRSGVVTVESEFLANIVLPNGRLLGEAIAPQIDEMYESGAMPALLHGLTKQLGAGT